MTDNRLCRVRFVVDGHTVFPGPVWNDENSDYIRFIAMNLYGVADGTSLAKEWRDRNGKDVYEDFPNEWVKVGRLGCCLFLGASAMNDGYDIVDDIADACGQDEYDAAWAMYSPEIGLREIDEGVQDSLCHNMLLVKSAWVEPPYRGHGVAQFMIRRAVDYCDHGNLGAILTLPNRDYFERNGTSAELLPAGAKDTNGGLARLRRHFTKMGFHRHPGRHPKARKFLFLRTTPRDMRKLRSTPSFKNLDPWWREALE